MANTAYTQQSLADDISFKIRLRASLVTMAFAVLAEQAPVTGRVAYARQVLNGLDREVNRISPIIVMRPNLMAGITSYDFERKSIVTTATDNDILAQLAADWDKLAGI